MFHSRSLGCKKQTHSSYVIGWTFIGETCWTGSQEESGNQALKGMRPGTRKGPSHGHMQLTWSLIPSQHVSPYPKSPLLPMFLNPNPRVACYLLLPPSVTRLAGRGVTSLPKNWLPSCTDFPEAPYSFFMTLIHLNNFWCMSLEEEDLNSLNHGEEYTWSGGKDTDDIAFASHTPCGWGLRMGPPLVPGAISGTRCLLRQHTAWHALSLQSTKAS